MKDPDGDRDSGLDDTIVPVDFETNVCVLLLLPFSSAANPRRVKSRAIPFTNVLYLGFHPIVPSLSSLTVVIAGAQSNYLTFIEPMLMEI